MSTPFARVQSLLERRSRAVGSLLRSLAHLDRERQFSVLTAYLSIDDLERLARFQERGWAKSE